MGNDGLRVFLMGNEGFGAVSNDKLRFLALFLIGK